MRKTSIHLALCAMLHAPCAAASAQQSEKIPRIVYLTSFGAPSVRQFDAFRQGLKEVGYIEGKTIVIDYRYPKEIPKARRP